MLVGLLVDGLNVVEERKVLVLLLHEDRNESVQVVDVGHRFHLLERLLVPLVFRFFLKEGSNVRRKAVELLFFVLIEFYTQNTEYFRCHPSSVQKAQVF